MLLIVAFAKLLDSHVSQVNHHVIYFSHVRSILLCTKSCKSTGVQIGFQRAVGCYENIHAQVELLASHQKRLFNVSTYDVSFLEVGLVLIERLHLRVDCPLFQLNKFVYKEDSLALSPSCRLHNPNRIGSPFKFINKHVVVLREVIGQRDNIEVHKVTGFILFSERRSFLLHLFPESLYVLYHQVLSRQFQMVWKVVKQPSLI